MMHALVKNYGRALELLLEVRDANKEDADVLFNIATCERELKNFKNADTVFPDLYRQVSESFAWLGKRGGMPASIAIVRPGHQIC